jgi:hypothetical protein
MAKAQFFVDRNVAGTGNLWNASFATLTASSEVSALPGANTQNFERATIWRSVSGTGEASLDLDLGAGYTAYPVTGVALANVKLVGAGVVKLQERGNAGSPGAASDVATLPTQDSRRRITYVTFAAVTKRHWRLLFTNPGADDDYAEIGYAWLGSYFEPGVNWSVPAEFPYVDPSIVRRSQGGQKSVVQRDPYYTAALQFRDIVDADFDALHAIFEIVRTTTPFVLALDAAEPWQNLLASFLQVTPQRGRSVGRTTWQCSVEEWL